VIGFILVFLYPLIGLLVGHNYPHMLLLFWAIPFPILIQIPKFGVLEDGIMLLVGVSSFIIFVHNWKKIKGNWIL